MRIPCAAIGIHPVIPDLLRILQHTRMLQHTGRLSAVLEEGAAVLLHRQRGAEGVLHHGNGAKAYQSIEAEAGNVQNFVALENNIFIMLTGNFIRVSMVGIKKLSVLCPVDLHVFREKRIQAKNAVLAISHNLCIGIAPQEQVRHHGFPEGEACHLRIGLPIQDLIQRVLGGLFFSVALLGKFVKVKRQAGHCLRQKPHTGVHRRNLHGGLFIHPLSAECLPENKNTARSPDVIFNLRQFPLRSIPRPAETKPFSPVHL